MPYLTVVDLDAENTQIGDLQLVGGQLVRAELKGASDDMYARLVAQRIRSVLLTHQGEWLLDQRIGFPWHRIMGKEWNYIGVSGVESLLTRAIESVPGVRSVVKPPRVVIDSQERTMTVSDVEVLASTGITIQVGTLDLPMIGGDIG